MTEHTVPVENYMWTPAGPILLQHIDAGHQLSVVKRDGTLTAASVRSVREAREREPSVRLLTGSGDVEVLLNTIITTRTGPRRVNEVVQEARQGRSEKLEIIRPVDLPRSLEDTEPGVCARAALRLLGGVVRIPWPMAEDSSALPRIREVVGQADVEHHEVELEKWLIIKCTTGQTVAKLSSPSELALAARMLVVLTAWEPDGNGWRSRLSLDDVSTRLVVLAGLSAAADEFKAYWNPRYWPVEFRLGRWSAPSSHWEIQGTLPPSGDAQLVMTVDAEPDSSLVVGRTLVRH